MKKSSKKLALTFGAVLLVSSFTGCASVSELGEKITGVFKGDESDSGSKKSSEGKSAVKTNEAFE